MSGAPAGTPGVEAPEPCTPVAVFVAQLDVRWGDLDAFNHVNNSTFLTYLEQARVQWMQTLSDWHDVAARLVVAAAMINYRLPIAWPERLAVELS